MGSKECENVLVMTDGSPGDNVLSLVRNCSNGYMLLLSEVIPPGLGVITAQKMGGLLYSLCTCVSSQSTGCSGAPLPVGKYLLISPVLRRGASRTNTSFTLELINCACKNWMLCKQVVRQPKYNK